MLKKMKLASKLAAVIGGFLALILIGLIFITARLSSSAITNAVSGELMAIAQANGNQVQQVFDAAQLAADNMRTYIETSYEVADEGTFMTEFPITPEAQEMCRSSIYGEVLTPFNYDLELYLSELSRSTAINNPDIAALGIMFERYKFQDNIRDYAFSVHENSAREDIKPYGTYEEYSKQDYYVVAASSKETKVTKPYEYDGVMIVTYASPVIKDNDLQGVVTADINISNFNKLQSTSEKYPSMYATIYDEEQTIIYDSEDFANAGKQLGNFLKKQDELEEIKGLMTIGEAFEITTVQEDGRKVMRYFTPIKAGDETWWSLTALNFSDVNKAVKQTVTMMAALSAIAVIALIFVIIYLLRRMLKPMEPLVEAAESIAAGNIGISLDVSSEDEIGILARAFLKMSDNLSTIVEDIDYLLGEMANGDFNVRTKAEQSYVGDFDGILKSMRKLNTTLSSTLGQIRQSADQVSTGSEQVSNGAQALSQGATEQASSVEELAATINEISNHVAKNAENAQQASEQASKTASELEKGKRQMAQMTEAMTLIDNSSGEIGKIIKTIEDIAFQTNILALNAAVEAARAGVAGKGFAVVADEVRNLAGKSAEASKNTASLIEATIKAVQQGTAIASETADSLNQIIESSERSALLVHQISGASKEQAASISQVTQGIDQISSVVQTNSATAEESAAASEELSGQAQMLKDLMERFKLKEIGTAVPDAAQSRVIGINDAYKEPPLLNDSKY